MQRTEAAPVLGLSKGDIATIAKAVRRIPGAWTCGDYPEEVDSQAYRTVSIFAPWDHDRTSTAFRISRDGSTYRLAAHLLGDELECDGVSGDYADLSHLLVGIRATIMGDSFSRSPAAHAKAEARLLTWSLPNLRQLRAAHGEVTVLDGDILCRALAYGIAALDGLPDILRCDAESELRDRMADLLLAWTMDRPEVLAQILSTVRADTGCAINLTHDAGKQPKRWAG